MPVGGSIPHATRPNEEFEQQADMTVAGMHHFAVPGGPQCGSCTFYGPARGGAPIHKRHRCRKAWRTGVKVKVGFFFDQTGCKHHDPRPPKPAKAPRARKAKVAA